MKLHERFNDKPEYKTSDYQEAVCSFVRGCFAKALAELKPRIGFNVQLQQIKSF